MKYILFILALALTINANAQNELQRSPGGAMYQLFTHNPGDKIKVGDVVTFQFIQKTDKDSVLMSSYNSGNKAQVQIADPKGITDMVELNLMQILPLLAVNDSVLVKLPTDSLFKGHEDQRPPFFPKGSNLNFVLKIERIQTLEQAIAERNALIDKIKTAEATDDANYIAAHKLVLTTTPSGLKYVITQPSSKMKPLKGDTLLVNYAGRTLDDKIFDSSIESVAQKAGLNQPGRTYEPIQVVVGTGGVIPGWDEGLLLLNEGSKATFVIPSNLAYGGQGQGDIKPYSTLVFDVELVKVKPIKHDATTDATASMPNAVSDIYNVDFNPYLGSTNKAANFKVTPSATGQVIKQYPLNARLYVFSNTDVNGYYKIIDIRTGKTGWVYKGSVKLGEKAQISNVGAFKPTGDASGDVSEVTLKNTSNKNISLIVGDDHFEINANSVKTVAIGKGKKYCIATSAGATPKAGFQEFVPNKKFEWQF